MSSPSRVVVLVEDYRQQAFVRRYLVRIGMSVGRIRFVSLPGGRGSGEQWVRERYAGEVDEYRNRSTRATTALIIAIDADTWDVNRRLQQLHQAIVDAGLNPRGNGEAIVHLIPKRNIETWVLCLVGDNVDEETDHRQRDIDDQINAAAVTFFEWSRPNAAVPQRCVPSLRAAMPEVRRLD